MAGLGKDKIKAARKTAYGGGGSYPFAARTPKRQKKILRDSILGITKPDVRRLARRGGVKRISMSIYPETRLAVKLRITEILRNVMIFLDHQNRKTVTTVDVVFALKHIGSPIWGFGTYERN